MRTPKARGKPVDTNRIESWVRRFDGYRVAVTKDRIHKWLFYFNSGDVDLAARVLDAVNFVNAEGMEKALRKTVERLPGWHKDRRHRLGKWRFLAFSTSAGESGDTMLHKCRTALGLTGVTCDELFIPKADLLKENLGADDSVAFIDDFAGRGDQACGWRSTLAELLPGNPKTYLILIVAGHKAVARIPQETLLKVFTNLVLGPDDDIFSPKCQHFTSGEKYRLLKYCKLADSRRPKGWGDCGFVIVLSHKTPNNSIPILHANRVRWRGLFPRHR